VDVAALAAELGVGGALWSAVPDGQAGLPLRAREQLAMAHLADTARNLRFRRGLVEAVQALNDAGITPLLFKGSLALVDGTLPDLGDRWMVDLDLAISAGQTGGAGAVLVDLGYIPEPGAPFLHPHELPYYRWRSGPIELHVELGSPPMPSVLPASEAWADSSEVYVGSGVARGLSRTHQVLHNIVHSAVQDLNHEVGGLPLRQLLELSRLVRVHGAAVDWALIKGRLDEHGLGRELRDHLWLAHRFAGMPLPDGAWPGRARWHERRVIGSFALAWPPHVHRNLRFAFGPAYLDSLYGHGNRPVHLAAARIRHAARLLRHDGRRVIRDVRARRS
jgi:hypothetical protein